MNKDIFRIIVLVPVIAVVALFFLPPSDMPNESQFYYQWWLARPLSEIEVIQQVGGYISIGLLLLSSAALVTFQKWGRPLYLIMVVFLLLVEIPQVPALIWGLAAFIDNSAKLAVGAVLAIIFFPSSDQWFSNESNTEIKINGVRLNRPRFTRHFPAS